MSYLDKPILSVEEFRRIRDNINNKINNFSLDNDPELLNITDKVERDNLEEKKTMLFLEKEYFPVIDNLRRYNLSEIPVDEFSQLLLLTFDDYVLDLSDTGANIDMGSDNFGAERYNFKGCNVSNVDKCPYLNEYGFDPDVIAKYPHLFLSANFSEEFKRKYYIKRLEMVDLINLSSEQINELLDKDLWYHTIIIDFSDFNGYKNKNLFNDLGVPFLVNLFNYSEEYFNDVIGVLTNFNFIYDSYPKDDNISKKIKDFFSTIKSANVSEVKNIVYEFTRQLLIEEKFRLSEEKYPESFVSVNKDLFLIDSPLPDEIKQKYFDRMLSAKELVDYIDLLPEIPIEKFLIVPEHSFGVSFVYFIVENYGIGQLQNLIKKHKVFFDFITEYEGNGYTDFSEFNSNYKEITGDLEADFVKAAKNYIIKHFISPFKDYPDVIETPEWVKSIGFSFVKNIDTMDEIKNVDELTIIFNNGQRQFFDLFGVDNIKRLEEETGILSFQDMKVFKTICEKFNYYSTFEELDFSKCKTSYEEFMKVFSQVLSMLRDSLIINYNYDDDAKVLYRRLAEIAPADFISADADSDIIRRFIRGKFVFPSDTYDFDKLYRPLLEGKNLRSIIKSSAVIKISAEEKIDFFEFCSEKFDNSSILDLLSLLAKLGCTIPDIDCTDCDNIELENIREGIFKSLYEKIISGEIRYDENMPKDFKEKYPRLFLPADTPSEIKEKFYGRKLTVADFDKNSELLNCFKNVDIALGFDISYMSWLNQVDDNKSLEDLNLKKLNIIRRYEKLADGIKSQYSDYIKTHFELIDDKSLKILDTVLTRLYYSNSAKLTHLYEELATSILQSANPLKKLEEIEQIYLSNHLPDVAKTYAVFRVFHTAEDGTLLIDNSSKKIASPFLVSDSLGFKSVAIPDFKEMAIFSDLIRAAIDSNSKSIRDYIKIIVEGDKLYKDILSGKEININDEEIQQKLNYYSRILIALHNNSLKGREKPYESKGEALVDIGVCTKLLSPDGTIDYDMPNRITKMFLHYAGFDTIEELTRYMDEKVQKTTEKNKEFSKDGTKLHKGQLIKGILSVNYLHSNLQNGCVSKDFLGSNAEKEGDCTPLDIDVALVMDDEIDIADGIKKSCAGEYAPPWIIIDTDEDFYDSTDNPKYQKGKYELFSARQSRKDWYGVRTGFGSTKIRCIIVNEYIPKIGFEIALAGFYIPVKDMQGKLLFSYEDYEKLVAKMAGLKHYDKPEFSFSSNLVTPEIEDLRRKKNADKERVTTIGIEVKKKIYEAISGFEFLPGKNLTPKGVMDGDLTAGFVEVIDTGSTGRETNAPGDGDFDFMLRIDNNILKDSDKIKKLRRMLCESFGVGSEVIDSKGEIRIKGVEIIPGQKVDVEISFKPRTDEINYSTDMCLKDRLSSIKKQDPEKYEYVVANICYAKKVLQEAGCYYKTGHSKCTGKGGLGGVGVENWILQHGGSFIDAARSFLEAAYNSDKTGFIPFAEFARKYQVWDFGENFREGRHDEFVYYNMKDQRDGNSNETPTSKGYEAMCKLLKVYIDQYDHKQEKGDELSDMLETPPVNDDGKGQIIV